MTLSNAKLSETTAHPNWQIASRALAAIVGGYAFTSACTILLACVMPLTRAESVLSSTLLSFVVYTCVIIWVYATASLKRVWLSLGLSSLLIASLGLLLTRIAA